MSNMKSIHFPPPIADEMVRAILANRKTVTRRVVKPQPKGQLVPTLPQSCWPGYFAEEGAPRVVRPPYRPGDILYVRETWAKPYGNGYYYAADYNDHDILKADNGNVSVSKNMVKWRPSIHMPREAARIFLRVADVRVERLRDIDANGAYAEGIPHCDITPHCAGHCDVCRYDPSPLTRFRKLWDSTIRAAYRYIYGWHANPWVWVIEFERISREEAEHADSTG